MGAQTTLADRLRAAIGGRPVDQVAREAGIDRQTLRGLLRGEYKRGPYCDTLEAIAKATGVRASWLAFGEEGVEDGP